MNKSTWMLIRRSDRLNESILVTVSIVLLWLIRASTLDEYVAISGFGPIGWIYKHFGSYPFSQDFPTGVDNFLYSSWMWVYPLAYKLLSVPPERMIHLVVAGEYALLYFGIRYLVRALFPHENDGTLLSLLVFLLFAGTNIRDANLANYGHPFIGQFYNAIDAIRLIIIGLVLRDRYLRAGALLAFLFTIHPTEGLNSMVFVVAMYVWQSSHCWRGKLASILIFGIASCVWIGWIQSQSMVLSSQLSNDLWIEISRVLNYHFFPLDRQLFTYHYGERLAPFLSLLFVWSAVSKESPEKAISQVALGVIAMLFLMTTGILLSHYSTTPLLIKLCLHRGTEFLPLMATIFVVHGLCREVTQSTLRFQLFATFLLSSSVLSTNGIPLVPALLYWGYKWNIAEKSWMLNCVKSTICLLLSVLALLYFMNGVPMQIVSRPFMGGVLNEFFILVLVGLYLLRRQGWLHFTRWRPLPIITIFIFTSVVGLEVAQSYRAGRDGFNNDYLAIQRWAESHTPEASCFLVDPLLPHVGWRDYSRRASFGVMREWFTEWLYNSSSKTFSLGMERASLFGFRLHELKDCPRCARNQLRSFSQQLEEVVYRSPKELFRICRSKNIDYVVLIRQKLTHGMSSFAVFENGHFVLLKVPSEDALS